MQKLNSYFRDESFESIYQKASNYFDLESRSTPEPYLPKQSLLSEEEITSRFESIHPAKNISIYIHIPFCESRCRFCDLYSFQIKKKSSYLIDEYVDALLKEISLMSELLISRDVNVTTIHFGGGSPLILSEEQIETLLDRLHNLFKITSETEIAFEVTVSQILPERLKHLKSINANRIHVGIQTLSNNLRELLGRREEASNIFSKVELLIEKDFITSADMLYGIPGQSSEPLISDLEKLINLNTDGFALYELQMTNHFDKHLKKYNYEKVSKKGSFEMMYLAKMFLNDSGYSNVFFNHYGNERDKNLYFTYPNRKEDCLAFGCIADSTIGNLFYRHAKYSEYMNKIKDNKLGIKYGYVEDPERTELRVFETALMSTIVTEENINRLENIWDKSFSGIFDLWKEAGLIIKNIVND